MSKNNSKSKSSQELKFKGDFADLKNKLIEALPLMRKEDIAEIIEEMFNHHALKKPIFVANKKSGGVISR